MTKSPPVLIVVLNWMKYEDTINCVYSLLKLTYANYEILIIDNASLNNSIEKLKKEFPQVLLIKSKENNGYAAGNQIGVDYALSNDFSLVWVLNNDCEARPDSLTELVKSYHKYGDALYSNTTLLSVNPDIIHYAGTYAIDESLQPEKFPTYDKLKGQLLSDHIAHLEDREARIYGHSMLIPVSIIIKHGFMDSDYFMFCEETEYTLRLNEKGIPSRYVAKAIITHISTSTFTLSSKMKYLGTYYGVRNRYHLDKKFPNGYRTKIMKQIGGWKGLVMFVLLNRILKRPYLSEEMHFTLLGLWHALLGKRGKTIDPVDFM